MSRFKRHGEEVVMKAVSYRCQGCGGAIVDAVCARCAEKVEFLEQMAREHSLPDIGKVLRCLVNYAREHPDRHGDIFGEVRCLDC